MTIIKICIAKILGMLLACAIIFVFARTKKLRQHRKELEARCMLCKNCKSIATDGELSCKIFYLDSFRKFRNSKLYPPEYCGLYEKKDTDLHVGTESKQVWSCCCGGVSDWLI